MKTPQMDRTSEPFAVPGRYLLVLTGSIAALQLCAQFLRDNTVLLIVVFCAVTGAALLTAKLLAGAGPFPRMWPTANSVPGIKRDGLGLLLAMVVFFLIPPAVIAFLAPVLSALSLPMLLQAVLLWLVLVAALAMIYRGIEAFFNRRMRRFARAAYA
ncbi:hypothetical protein IV500_01720 [Paeniglutamicibacter antarcticus]|uniref:Transmembrane protein n=1 Tax=Arthrobacter terrae TaxID=2935737 RepID=A0A931CMI0_9MICC|nr:hypothetical protein [Arthrobacter terrae]MBG0738154.1 hypothetical protein [Arthrobacter terrae]